MPGLLITNGEFVGRWSSTDSVTIEIGPRAQGKVSLVNCSFWGPIDRCIWARRRPVHRHGLPLRLGYRRSRFAGASWWTPGGRSSRATRSARESATSGWGKVRSAIVMGNQAINGMTVVNLAGSRTQIIGNEPDGDDVH